jgi:hypothetical protein
LLLLSKIVYEQLYVPIGQAVNEAVKYRKVIQSYILPALGEIKLEKLTPQHVKSLYNQKQRDRLSPKTIHSIHGVLHKALDNAVLWNLASRNVCKVVKPLDESCAGNFGSQ